MLSIAGFFLEFKPSEPFLTNYLIQNKGLTNDQVGKDVYPISVYSYFAFILPVGFLSEFIGYKNVVILGVVARELTRILLLWSEGLFNMQLMQITFGFAMAAEIIYYSYIYLLVPQSEFQLATSLIRSLPLVGHVIAGIVGQSIVSMGYDYVVLFYISFSCVSVGFLIILAMPDTSKPVNHESSVTDSVATPDDSVSTRSFILEESAEEIVSSENNGDTFESTSLSNDFDNSVPENLSIFALCRKIGFYATFSFILKQFKSGQVFLWSSWFWLGDSIHGMVMNYNTVLFQDLSPHKSYNGVVLAVGRFFAALMSAIPILLPSTVLLIV